MKDPIAQAQEWHRNGTLIQETAGEAVHAEPFNEESTSDKLLEAIELLISEDCNTAHYKGLCQQIGAKLVEGCSRIAEYTTENK